MIYMYIIWYVGEPSVHTNNLEVVRKAKGLYDGHCYLIALREYPKLGVFS